MERSKFETLVAQALDGLPRTFRDKLTNVAIIVEDLPPKEAESEGLLLGLFHGIPRTEKSVFSSSPPDRIFLYQRNIEAVCTTEAEVLASAFTGNCSNWDWRFPSAGFSASCLSAGRPLPRLGGLS